MYIHEFDNLDEIGQFLASDKPPKFIQEAVNLNNPTFFKQIYFVVKNLPTEKT